MLSLRKETPLSVGRLFDARKQVADSIIKEGKGVEYGHVHSKCDDFIFLLVSLIVRIMSPIQQICKEHCLLLVCSCDC